MKKRTTTKQQVDTTKHYGYKNGETAIYAMVMKEHYEQCIQKQLDAGIENPKITTDFYDFAQFSQETKNKIMTAFFVKIMFEDVDSKLIVEKLTQDLREKSNNSVVEE